MEVLISASLLGIIFAKLEIDDKKKIVRSWYLGKLQYEEILLYRNDIAAMLDIPIREHTKRVKSKEVKSQGWSSSVLQAGPKIREKHQEDYHIYCIPDKKSTLL